MTATKLCSFALCAALVSTHLIVPAAPAAAQTCNGDCNDDRSVAVDEIILGVRIALGDAPLGDCQAMDADGDGAVTVNDLLAAVTHALQGCGGQIGEAAQAASARVATEPIVRLFDFQARVGTPGGVAGRSVVSSVEGEEYAMKNDFDMGLFAPEVILPAQMSWGARCDGNTSGVRALMIAILEDAVLCIDRGRRRRHPQTRRLAAEAETWVRSDGREWLFSFANICDVLGIDPEAVRVRLLTPGRPASGERAARPEADEPSIPSGAMVRMLPRCEGARGSIAAVATARAPARHTGGDRGSGAGFGGRAVVRVA
jgi:hypothetical protein